MKGLGGKKKEYIYKKEQGRDPGLIFLCKVNDSLWSTFKKTLINTDRQTR